MTSTRAVRIWLAVDVLLVTVLLVLVVVVTSGGSPSTPVASPTASRSTTATAPSTSPVAVRLPSGNISCVVSVDGATCAIASITYDPPAVAGCTGRTGHVIVLDADGVSFPCEKGPAPTVAGKDVQTLSYGGSVTVGDYTCTSATNGATCVDGDGRGFRVARAGWTKIS
ncbi:hypothetical protein [Cellulomonas edaphi]|uniref:Uncharacterized protein n=1 Tax=Cellulomonas edaphi TaxID=3053468 RepID=A0ABT7SCA2_9CELL|nr:hypothetical protein [Cellulomons edaphi]MDM7832627.1 hypothetical protein [Cellulomons edaphi]